MWRIKENKGAFNITEAFFMLEKEIMVENMMGSSVLPPVIILMANSSPSVDYKYALEELKKQPWFRKATKFGIVRDDCDEETYDLMKQFTGNEELILRTEAIRYISKMFRTFHS